MSQADILSILLPSLPELNEILSKIREKYLIEVVRPENKELIKTTSEQYTVEEWEEIRQEIENELRAWFQPKSSGLDKVTRLYRLIIKNWVLYIREPIHIIIE